MEYLIVKWLHILSSTLLLGTGMGSAYYMLMVSLTRDVRAIAVVVRKVVLADGLFTTTAIIFQPLSGFYLARLVGFPLMSRWLVWSYALYLFAGACWLPAVWMQIRMRDMAERAVASGEPLPPLYWRMLRLWGALGVPAFFALVIVFWLMVARPM
jgi:uncharacterized membrane protein